MSKYDSLFVKIPNGIIELSNRVNSYTSLTYLFLAINRNMLGKVNSSILFLEECYVDDSMENQKTKASKISKILSSLYLLSNTIVNRKKEIISESVIDIPKYGDYFNCCEFDINTCEKDIELQKENELLKNENANLKTQIKNNNAYEKILELLKNHTIDFKRFEKKFDDINNITILNLQKDAYDNL